MPDVIPASNGEETQHRCWADELCASCKAVFNCPLLAALHKYNIQTFSGIHVSNCDLYDPDLESKYYIAPDAPMERIKEMNLQTMHEHFERLRESLGRLDEQSVS